MGYVREKTGIDLTGGGQREAAEEAAKQQEMFARDAMQTIRGDLSPFTEAGAAAVQEARGSVLDPTSLSFYQPQQAAQVTAQDVLSDPFFQQLAQDQERSAIAQRAGLGLGGSVGTGDILQRNLLQLGEGFRQQRQQEGIQRQAQQAAMQAQGFEQRTSADQARFNQLFNLANLGQASAAQTGAQSANLLTDIGSARSTVPLVGANVASQQGQQAMNLVGGLFGAGGGFPALGNFML